VPPLPTAPASNLFPGYSHLPPLNAGEAGAAANATGAGWTGGGTNTATGPILSANGTFYIRYPGSPSRAGAANVLNTPSGSTVTLVMFGSSPTISVGNAGSVPGILGTLVLSNPGGLDIVVLDDSADTVARTVTCGSDTINNTVTGLAPAAIEIPGADTRLVTLDG
jgi:hypothetical protein